MPRRRQQICHEVDLKEGQGLAKWRGRDGRKAKWKRKVTETAGSSELGMWLEMYTEDHGRNWRLVAPENKSIF